MTLVTDFPDDEELIKAWVKTTPVLGLAEGNVYIAMPQAAPIPCVTMTRVGGSVPFGSDIPYQLVRISFDCWSTTRSAANTLARQLVAQVLNLGEVGGYYDPDLGRIYSGDVVSMSWLPDPQADIPRYVVDASFATIAA